MPTSSDFRKLADERLKDAEELLGIKRWSCAYYISGYAVECILKAIIIREVEQTGILFDDRKDAASRIEKFFSHDLKQLLSTASLDPDFGLAQQADHLLKRNWEIVTGWKESSRYQLKGQAEAEELFRAISDDPHGVMIWLQNR